MTMSLSKSACLLIMTLNLMQSSGAIKCWDCDSEADPACGDPFKNETFSISDCSLTTEFPNTMLMCKKIIIKSQDGHDRIMRDCAGGNDLIYDHKPELSFPQDEVLCGTIPNRNYTLCLCGTDGCNSIDAIAIVTHANSSPKATMSYWLVHLFLLIFTVYFYQ